MRDNWGFQTGDLDRVSAADGDILGVRAYVKVRYIDSFVTESNGRIGLNFEVAEPDTLEGQKMRDYFGAPSGDPLEDNKKVWPFWKALLQSGGIALAKGQKLSPSVLKKAKFFYAYFIPKEESESGYQKVVWMKEEVWRERAAKFVPQTKREEPTTIDDGVKPADDISPESDPLSAIEEVNS